MNKSGSMLDMTMILVSLFLFAFVTVMMYNVYGQFTDNVNQMEAFNNTYAQHVESQTEATFTTLDFVYAFLLILFTVLAVVSAFAIRTHPIFFVVSIVMLVILVIIGAIMANVYSDLESEQGTYLDDSNFNIIPFVMQHFPTLLLVVGALLSVAMFAKSKWEED